MSHRPQDGTVRLGGRWVQIRELAYRCREFTNSFMAICLECGEEYYSRRGGSTRPPKYCDVCMKHRRTISRVLTEGEVGDIKKQLRAGAVVNTLAKTYSVNWMTIAAIRDRRTWRWVR